MRWLPALLLMLLPALLAPPAAGQPHPLAAAQPRPLLRRFAQPAVPQPPSAQMLSIGGPTTLGLMTGELNGTFVQIGSDLSTVASSDALRVVPLLGKGSLQNLGDLFNLRGVDLALATADSAASPGAVKLHPNLRARVSYIAKLYDQEIHILAGPDIHNLEDLAGKTVNADVAGSGTFVTATAVFDALRIPAKLANDTPTAGLERLRRGEIAAAVYVIGKPGRLFATLPANSGLHLVPLPLSEEMLQTYVPSTLTHADYPALIAEGDTLETMAVPVLLTARNWPAGTVRYRNLAAFTDLFFSHFQELQQPPYHPKWHDVNLRATVLGWTRAPYAQAWLDRAATPETPATTAEERGFAAWAAGIGLTSITPVQRTQLFSLWRLRQAQK